MTPGERAHLLATECYNKRPQNPFVSVGIRTEEGVLHGALRPMGGTVILVLRGYGFEHFLTLADREANSVGFHFRGKVTRGSLEGTHFEESWYHYEGESG